MRDLQLLDEECLSVGPRSIASDSVYSHVASLREMKVEYKKRVGMQERLVTNVTSEHSPQSAAINAHSRFKNKNEGANGDNLDQDSLRE